MSAYCPIVTPNFWKIEVVRALCLVHSVSTIQLPLQLQQVIRTLLFVFEVLVLSTLILLLIARTKFSNFSDSVIIAKISIRN